MLSRRQGESLQQADLRSVKLQRRLPGKPARFKLARLNLLDLLMEGDQFQNPYLFDGTRSKLNVLKKYRQRHLRLQQQACLQRLSM